MGPGKEPEQWPLKQVLLGANSPISWTHIQKKFISLENDWQSIAQIPAPFLMEFNSRKSPVPVPKEEGEPRLLVLGVNWSESWLDLYYLNCSCYWDNRSEEGGNFKSQQPGDAICFSNVFPDKKEVEKHKCFISLPMSFHLIWGGGRESRNCCILTWNYELSY